MIDTHNLKIEFGKYKGERWTRLPIPYLKWLINVNSQFSKIAQAELDRRGIITPDKLELSAHAIDRASLHCFRQWRDTRNNDEGLFTWLYRISNDALAKGDTTGPDKEIRYYLGMKFVFKFGELNPTLITVMNELQNLPPNRLLNNTAEDDFLTA